MATRPMIRIGLGAHNEPVEVGDVRATGSRKRIKNTLFHDRRVSLPSPSGVGCLSRRELAAAANAVYEGNDGPLTENCIGKIEQGITTFPRPHRRAALRRVLGAATDAEIGFVNKRSRPADDPEWPETARHRIPTTATAGTLADGPERTGRQAHAPQLAPSSKPRDDAMNRRQFISGAMAAGSSALLGSADDATTDGLWVDLTSSLGGRSADDWVRVCEEYGHRGMVEPPSQVKSGLVGELRMLQQELTTSDAPALRGVAARLVTLLAMTEASLGRPAIAIRWYNTAASAADRSQDPFLRAWVRGRAVLRGEYDGYATADSTLATVQRSLSSLESLPVARMELQVATARAYARIGHHSLAKSAFSNARRAYHDMPKPAPEFESMYYLPEWRFELRGAYVAAMAGDIEAVDNIVAGIRADQPGGLLRWKVQCDLNRALAHARAGDGPAARELVTSTVEATPAAQHTQTMRQLVEAVTTALPANERDSVEHLRDLMSHAA